LFKVRLWLDRIAGRKKRQYIFYEEVEFYYPDTVLLEISIMGFGCFPEKQF